MDACIKNARLLTHCREPLDQAWQCAHRTFVAAQQAGMRTTRRCGPADAGSLARGGALVSLGSAVIGVCRC